jgi:hypothetical protein
MKIYFKNGILEDLDTVQHIRIGRFWNVILSITPLTWLGPFIFFALHLVLNLWRTNLDLTDRLYQAFIFTISVEICTVLHAFGHILSGKMVRSAMDELLIASTRDINLYYADQSQVPGKVHMIRSLGGPLFNLICVGLFAALLPIAVRGFGHDLTVSLISVNLFFGLGGLLPIPTVDGEVIWRELLHRKEKNAT